MDCAHVTFLSVEINVLPLQWWQKLKHKLYCILGAFSKVVVQLLSHVQFFVTHGLHHARIPCPSLSPEVCSNSCPLSQWCHPTISSSVAPFSSCLQSFPASDCFPMSQFLTSDGQSTGASASASVLPMNIQGWFPSGLTCWISLLFNGLSRVFSSTTVWKHQKYLPAKTEFSYLKEG